MTERLSFKKRGKHWLYGAVLLAACGGLTTSCDGYDLDEKLPDGWGYSIYDYMASQGNYTNMVRVIDDLMRVALRRNDPIYLAAPVSKRNGTVDSELYQKLLNTDNWYLKKQ